MRINALNGLVNVRQVGGRTALKNTQKNASRIVDINDFRPLNYSVALSFGQGTLKNVAQVASIAPEYQGILNSIYKKGGLGNVAGEAAVAFSDKGGLDIRTFVPYYSGDNADGGVRVLSIKESDIEQTKQRIINGETPKQLGESVTLKTVKPEYQLKNGETFIIQQAIDENVPLKKQYTEIEPTTLKGAIKSINEDMVSETNSPYHVFKVKGTGVGVQGKPPVYLVHTPDVARFGAAYNCEGAYCGKLHTDALYTRFTRAVADAIPKMNTEEFENYNPGNYWLHDRQAFPFMLDVSEQSAAKNSYWSGIRVHATYHNIGPAYQGHYSSPIDFMQIAGSSKDLEELKKNPADYNFVKKMAKKIIKERNNGSGKFSPEEILSKEEMTRLNKIFEPVFGRFLDENGHYNMCEIPIAAVKVNPYNTTVGTVSRHYAREMKNPNTQEVSQGISKHLASIPTIDIVNGSSAVNLGLDSVGKMGNGTGLDMTGFKPFSPEVMKNPEKFFKLKQSNKEWLINALSKELAKGEESAKSVLFSKSDIENGARILGNISPYKKGDILFISWGRGDTQKGFPVTLEGFLQYLKDDSVSSETKEHTKFVIGADPWRIDDEVKRKAYELKKTDPDAAAKMLESQEPDWISIKSKVKEIQELDGGKYKDNICYLNGRFSNRIVACADYTNITSRYEPCGITPLESFAGGTPVISNNTGGSPNFIEQYVKGKSVTSENGFLTHHAFLSNPENLGLDKNLTGKALDDARVGVLGKENAECIKNAVTLFENDKKGYMQMAQNALNSKIDWHENLKYNAGISAMNCYKSGAWGLTSANKEIEGFERNCGFWDNLKGQFAKNSNSKNLGLYALGAAVCVGAAAFAFKFIKGKHAKKIAQTLKTNTQNNTIDKASSVSMLKNSSMDDFSKLIKTK